MKILAPRIGEDLNNYPDLKTACDDGYLTGCFFENQEIDEEIQSVSIGWNLGRMSKVVLAIIRLAVAEMKYMEDIPVSVSINEAVELSKIYASGEDASFVNGVLGTISRKKEG